MFTLNHYSKPLNGCQKDEESMSYQKQPVHISYELHKFRNKMEFQRLMQSCVGSDDLEIVDFLIGVREEMNSKLHNGK